MRAKGGSAQLNKNKNEVYEMSVVNAVSVGQAIAMVVNFIKENELYSFQSLAEETQAKLIDTYGSSFELAVNGCLDLA